MKNELNTNNSKKLILGISILFCTVFLIIGVSFAFFTQSDTKNLGNVVTTNVTLDYKDNTTYMRNNIIPVVESDVTKFASKNKLNNYTDNDICHYQNDMYACSLYEFTITNTANVSQNIIISMTPTLNEYNNLYFILYERKANELNNDLNKVVNNTKIEQDTINFNNANIILKPKESKTYTIVFYIKSLDIPQDDANKRFSASILVNSVTTGYKVVSQVGEGCYNYEELDDGTLKLTKFNGIDHETGDIIESCGVTKDDEGFYSVTVPSTYAGVSVSTLGNTLYSAVKTLEDGTFTGMNQFINIKKIDINEGIKIIEDGIYDVENLKGNGTFMAIGADLVTLSSNPNRKLEISLPNSLEYIGDVSFAISALNEITIPSNVLQIGDYTFIGNSNMYKLTFEENSRLQIIGNYAFGGANISLLIIPNSVQTIENGAFSSNNISSLTIPNSVETIGESAFIFNNLSSLTIPSSVETIGNDVFKCNYLENLTFSLDDNGNSQLRTIGESAFNGIDCFNEGHTKRYRNDLTYTDESNPLFIPSSVTSIGESAFDRNSNLNYIYFEGDETGFGNWWNGDATLLPRRN